MKGTMEFYVLFHSFLLEQHKGKLIHLTLKLAVLR